ncbi:MAG TPA: hypothetical protein DCS24_05115 [Erythrobacter sp.]|nr:hypothetical protein [Erythrobacter sp.]
MRATFTFILAISLAACGSDSSGTFETSDGEEGSYSINQDGGEVTARITSDEGTTTIRSGKGVDAELPDGYSMYPGATIVSATTMSGDSANGSMVNFESDAAPDDIIAHFREQAEADGIEIKMEMKTGSGQILNGEGEDGRVFSITVSNDGDKSSGNLMVGNSGS